MNDETAGVRHAVRALIVDGDNCVLLMRLNMPNGRVWLTPGGGKESGETTHGCLTRELAEEVGRDDLSIGPELWQRRIHYQMKGRPWTQHERIFLIRTDRFEPSAANLPFEAERDWFECFGWWSADEIDRLPDRVGPIDLAARLRVLITDGAPETPIDITLRGD
jgi:8-oxo-dGTP diphosphatase